MLFRSLSALFFLTCSCLLFCAVVFDLRTLTCSRTGSSHGDVSRDLGMFLYRKPRAWFAHIYSAHGRGGAEDERRETTPRRRATRLSQRGRPRTLGGPSVGPVRRVKVSSASAFRLVFSFRPVAAGGAGWGIKGQAPPFGECDSTLVHDQYAPGSRGSTMVRPDGIRSQAK